MVILNFPHVKVFRISSLSRNAPASGAGPDVRPEQSLGHLLWERKTTMKTNLILAAVIAGFVATTVAAQTTTFDNRGAAETFNDDLDEQMEDDRDRDLTGFGTEGRELGDYGSIALRYTSTSNDGDTSNDLGVGLRYGWFDGVNGIDTNASYAYGETNGVISENRFLGGVDYRRNLSDTFLLTAKLTCPSTSRQQLLANTHRTFLPVLVWVIASSTATTHSGPSKQAQAIALRKSSVVQQLTKLQHPSRPTFTRR
jgi:hypothetical protein